MRRLLNNEKGFTLVELLIVVIILGVLAAVIIPQFGSSTADAKLSTLDANLSHIRNAVERYYHDHNSVYPGAKNIADGSDIAAAADCQAAFEQQLLRYSEVNGKSSVSKTAAAKYGPYIKKTSLPKNPFNDLATVVCDIATTDITAAVSDGTTGWKFYMKTGRFMANDGAHDSN